jgi:hypothetical protein
MLIARPQASWTEFALWAIGGAVACVLVLSPYLILNVQLNGTLLPNTSAAKQAENAPLLALPIWQRVINMLYPLSAGGQLILLPGALYTILLLYRRVRIDRRALLYWIPPMWVGGLVLLYALRLPAPYQHGRYVIPALNGLTRGLQESADYLEANKADLMGGAVNAIIQQIARDPKAAEAMAVTMAQRAAAGGAQPAIGSAAGAALPDPPA